MAQWHFSSSTCPHHNTYSHQYYFNWPLSQSMSCCILSSTACTWLVCHVLHLSSVCNAGDLSHLFSTLAWETICCLTPMSNTWLNLLSCVCLTFHLTLLNSHLWHLDTQAICILLTSFIELRGNTYLCQGVFFLPVFVCLSVYNIAWKYHTDLEECFGRCGYKDKE